MVATDEYFLATGLDDRLSDREDTLNVNGDCSFKCGSDQMSVGLQHIKQIKVIHNLGYGTRKAEINSLKITRNLQTR